MHNWLEHLTHTNIHIRREEAIPQGGDGAICGGQTNHSRQRKHKQGRLDKKDVWLLN